MKRSPMPMLVLAVLLGLGPGSAGTAEFDHSNYETFLGKYVRGGLVDYKAVKREPSHLVAYLQRLEAVDPADFEGWDRNAKIALWIDAYNAITIYGIVLNYPIEYGGLIARLRFPKSSVRQIDNFWSTVFVKVMGREFTLDQIEHEILRGQFRDPRIHFALVCASKGCPVLSNHAYVGERLQQQLDRDVRRFIANRDKVKLDMSRNKLYTSAIFQWYADDFRIENPAHWLEAYPESYRGVVDLVAGHLEERERNYIVDSTPGLEFLDYDWSLNELDTDTGGRLSDKDDIAPHDDLERNSASVVEKAR